MSTPTPTPADLDRTPLSYQQEFLCAFDDGGDDGPFGPRYHNCRGLRLRGEVEVAALRQALADVVERHETLRTVLVRGDGDAHQRVIAAGPPDLVVSDLAAVGGPERERGAEEFLNEVEAGTISVERLPLLRAHLGRFDERDAVLVLIAHHTATDGWSMRLIIRDLALFYAHHTGGSTTPPPVRPYREFTRAQRAPEAAGHVDLARPYWRQKLDGARLLAIPMDRPRSGAKVTSTHRFHIDPQLVAATFSFARATRSSGFIVLQAAYNLLLHRLTGATDIAVPTISSGRGDPRFEDTVGPFFNFLPLRTDLTGCRTPHDVVSRTRRTCLEAQTYEIPFTFIGAQAPQLMSTFEATDRAVGAFQVFQHPYGHDGRLDARLAYTEIRRRSLFQPVSGQIPDGLLWTFDIDPTDGVFGSLKFNRHEFDHGTITTMVDSFSRALHAIVTTPDELLAPT